MMDRPKRIIQVRPAAPPARLMRRHMILALAYMALVIGPLIGVWAYLATRAQPQYETVTGFTVRQEQTLAPNAALGGLAQVIGGAGGVSADTDILHEFIRSADLTARLEVSHGLGAHYSAPHARDPIFALDPDADSRAALSHWRRQLRLSYDRASGLIELRLRAFSPDMALALSAEIIRQSENLINDLNMAARENLLTFAQSDLAAAQDELARARQSLTDFRIRQRIVDPTSDVQGRMGVLNTLQQQLAEALIALDLLSGTTSADDPRLTQATRRIEVIRARIEEERASFATAGPASESSDYPNILAQYEALATETSLAEMRYAQAQAALDQAEANFARQTRYLAVFIRPALPSEASHPRAGVILGLWALFAHLIFAVGALSYYALRDRQ